MAFFFALLKTLSANSNDGSNDDGGRGDSSDDGGSNDDGRNKPRLEPRCRLRLRQQRLVSQRFSLRFA